LYIWELLDVYFAPEQPTLLINSKGKATANTLRFIYTPTFLL